MARTRKGTPPAYPTKPHVSGQARITIRLATGKRHCLTMGVFGSKESREQYQRILAVLEAHGGCYPVKDNGMPASGVTLNELVLLFWKHAERYYRLGDGSPSRELEIFKASLEPVLDLYGDTLAREFGPAILKAVRETLINKQRYRVKFVEWPDQGERWVSQEAVRKANTPGCQAQWSKKWHPAEVVKTKAALSRKVINQRIDHVKRVFAWAVSEELVPASVHAALKLVAGLRPAEPGTRETAKVKPVLDQHVAATLPHLVPQVQAMVQIQPLMGARPTEICLMRGARNIIDQDKPVWKYVIDPNEVTREQEPTGRIANLHKTGHQDGADGHAKIKVLPIGPRAQAILKPWLRDDPNAFLFQPREARAALYSARRKDRQTPLYPSHVAHEARKKKAQPQRVPRDHYDRYSYNHAVARAAQKAGVPHWHPHQLKHVCGTRIREAYGAEAAQGYLGHEKLSTAELYAEKNWKLIEQIALEMG